MTSGHLAFTSASYGARTDGRNPMRTRILSLLTLAVVAAAAAGTATGRTPTMPPASSFTARVDNAWFPLQPGTRYLYTWGQGRQILARRRHGHAADEEDRRRALRHR